MLEATAKIKRSNIISKKKSEGYRFCRRNGSNLLSYSDRADGYNVQTSKPHQTDYGWQNPEPAANNYLECRKPLSSTADCTERAVRPQPSGIPDARFRFAMMMSSQNLLSPFCLTSKYCARYSCRHAGCHSFAPFAVKSSKVTRTTTISNRQERKGRKEDPVLPCAHCGEDYLATSAPTTNGTSTVPTFCDTRSITPNRIV